MTVFKQYFKIVKKYLSIIVIYTFIFTGFAIAASTSGNTANSFSAQKAKVAIIDNDNSTLSNLMKDYLKTETKVIELDVDDQADALFYRKADTIITIPDNFEKDIFDNPKIGIKSVPDSAATFLVDQFVNRFMNSAVVYKKSNFTDSELKEHLLKDLQTDGKVNFLAKDQVKLEKVNYFYNFLNYALLAITISIIGIIMSSFLDQNIKRRNLVSSTSYRNINFQLLLGNAFFALLIWLLYACISFGLYGTVMFSSAGLLLLLNTLVFAICALSIGFLLGSTVKNKEAQNGIANVVSLGSSFISGSFVPQMYLGAFVLSIAKFTPSYWFIKNNDSICSLAKFDWNSISPIIGRMAIILGFSIIFFIITNIITRKTREKN